jgi:hypothetical protein
MKFLSENECHSWIRRQASQAECSFRRPAGGIDAETLSLERLPAHQVYAIVARGIAWAGAASAGNECLIWVREHGVWPSNERLFLYRALRQCFNDQASVAATPGHLCDPTEREVAEALAFLCVCYGWGFTALWEGGVRALNVDHDGVAWLTGEGSAILNDSLRKIQA